MIIAYIAIVLETLLAAFIIWGILNEQKLVRIEHAAVKALIWEIYERFVERDAKRLEG